MRNKIRSIIFVIGIVLSSAYHTLALVPLTMQAHSLNAPASRRIIGYQCKNPTCGKVFANLFAYDQHRNHARCAPNSPGGPSCACSACSATARFGWSEQRKAHANADVALPAHRAMIMLLVAPYNLDECPKLTCCSLQFR